MNSHSSDLDPRVATISAADTPEAAPVVARRGRKDAHIAYIMWHFPLLSETFIQREISALRSLGVRITVIADALVETPLLGNIARDLKSEAIAILPMDKRQLAGARRGFLRRRPWRYLSTRWFLAANRYHERDNRKFDKLVLDKAVYIAALCREIGITHIHSPWSDLNAVTGMIAADLLDVPFSVQARAHDIHRHSYRHGLGHVFRRARLVITNTDYNAVHLARTYPGITPKLKRIYNGIPLDTFRYHAPRPIDGRPLALLCVARLIEQKGLDDLLKVCDRLRSRGIQYRASIIGGPEAGYEGAYNRLVSLRRALGLETDVEFAGETSHDDVVDAYRHADIFILPSRLARDGSRDIIPNAILEAMACGVPVVSTRVTGIPEIIDDGVDGLLREACDVDGIARAVVELASDSAFRQRVSRAARKKIESRFDITRNVLEYEKAYRSLQPFCPTGTTDCSDGHLS